MITFPSHRPERAAPPRRRFNPDGAYYTGMTPALQLPDQGLPDQGLQAVGPPTLYQRQQFRGHLDEQVVAVFEDLGGGTGRQRLPGQGARLFERRLADGILDDGDR